MTITEYIAEDLLARVREEEGLGDALTLQALSRHYGVSLTPVRHALQSLIDRKVLRRCSNGRVEINPLASEPKRPEPTTTNLRKPRDPALLEAALSAEVIQLGLRGRAVLIREEETAGRLAVGRTIVRQVLNRLAGQGLVEHLPRRGWRVRTFDEADLTAYLQVRESLELTALELSKTLLVKADLQAMLRGNDGRPGDEETRIDNAIHSYLVEKSGNRYLREFFDGPGTYYTTLFDYAALEARVVSAMAGQHRAILLALIAEDWPRAREALRSHIRAQLPIVRAVMKHLASNPLQGHHREETS